MKGNEFSRQLREGKYTSLGSYPKFLVLADGACLCIDCAREESARLRLAAMCKSRNGWVPAGFDVNWEDPDLFCDNCGTRIESAYAEAE